MKPREWRNDAWHLSVKHGYPGSVPVIIKALEHGYEMGIADASKLLREALDKEAERKRRSNQQQV